MIEEILAIIVAAFLSVNTAQLWSMNRRTSRMETAISILCREHVKNHHGQKIPVDE
jgi:hypothetical protein